MRGLFHMLEKSRDMPDGAFRKRPVDADKYSVGTVAVIGGSTRYPNAPVITGLGARAAGAGLVSLVVPEESRMCAAAHLPEATFARFSVPFVPPRADVFVVGMGLGVSADSEQVVSSVLSGNCGRFVLDADALTIIASWSAGPRGFAPVPGQEIIMTPHEGEAARLLGATRESVKSDRLSAAKVIATKYGATVVLKGPGTLVVSNDGSRIYVNGTGNPFMALGGMGDLLAGTMGARWAYLKSDAFTAACSAVWLHGAASDRLVAAERDASILNTAAEIGSLRIHMDR